jgi:hypothetical protein
MLSVETRGYQHGQESIENRKEELVDLGDSSAGD